MIECKSLIINKAAFPPPKLGRNFFVCAVNAEKPVFIGYLRGVPLPPSRRFDPERDVNTTVGAGEYTGNLFTTRSAGARV